MFDVNGNNNQFINSCSDKSKALLYTTCILGCPIGYDFMAFTIYQSDVVSAKN